MRPRHGNLRQPGTLRLPPLERLDRLIVGPGLLAVHAVHLETGEIDLLARYGASVAHCPASNLKLASGIAPYRGNGRRRNQRRIGNRRLPATIALTCSPKCVWLHCLPKGTSGDAAALPARQALRMATLGGDSRPWEAENGSPCGGKAADLCR